MRTPLSLFFPLTSYLQGVWKSLQAQWSPACTWAKVTVFTSLYGWPIDPFLGDSLLRVHKLNPVREAEWSPQSMVSRGNRNRLSKPSCPELSRPFPDGS